MGRSDQYGVGRERLRAFVVSFLFSAEGAGARPWGVVRSRSSRSEECRVSRGWSSGRGRRRAHRRDRRRACSHSDRGLLGKSRAPPDGGRGHGSKTAELAVAERIDRTIAPDRLARIDPAQIRHRVDAGEDADQSPAFCDQDRADAALEHRGQCRGERFVGAHDIGVLGLLRPGRGRRPGGLSNRGAGDRPGSRFLRCSRFPPPAGGARGERA